MRAMASATVSSVIPSGRVLLQLVEGTSEHAGKAYKTARQ